VVKVRECAGIQCGAAMKLFPDIKIVGSADLKPGELFMAVDHSFGSFFAIKTVGGPSLVLGPTNDDFLPKPRLVDLSLDVQLSYGSEFVVVLPTTPEAWTRSRPSGISLCLSKNGAYLCFDGNNFPGIANFLSIISSEVINSVPRPLVFTESWQICLSRDADKLTKILQFPLRDVARSQ
jgi:hypothetical protein